MSIVLILGFFYSCGTGEISIDALVENNEYAQALTRVDEQLESNPENADLYYHKSRILALMAKEQPVDQRDSLYQEMALTIDRASQLTDPPSLSLKLDTLWSETWRYEHVSGLDRYEEGEESYEQAIAHFRNAITVNGEKLSSYKALSVAQYNNGDIDGAINTLDVAKNIDNMDPEIYGNLGFLYLEKGNAEQAAFYYELAGEDVVQNKNIAFGLVNAYLANDNTEDAKDLLSELVESYPEDGRLHNVYGSVLFNEASALFQDLRMAYQRNDTANVTNLTVEVVGTAEMAEEELQKAYTADSSNPDFIESLAVFYNNMAGNYFSLMEIAFEGDKPELETRAVSLIDFAIDYYEQLEELQPQNSTYQTKIQNLRTLKENRTTN